MDNLKERFVFRNILPEEADQAARIEKICFPPNEACSESMMKERVATAPELFLVAIDTEHGKMAGFMNGLSTRNYMQIPVGSLLLLICVHKYLLQIPF